MKFSERKGYKQVPEIIQADNISDDLRASLWNALQLLVFDVEGFLEKRRASAVAEIDSFSTILWFKYFKKPIDTRPEYGYGILKAIRDYFFSCRWFEVYDFLECALEYFKDDELNDLINRILDQEFSAYRYVEGVFTDITSEEEIKALEEALNDSDFPGAKKHLETALQHLSNKENPDYRNSIKESISAVESMAQVITGDSNATLGTALKVIERTGDLHPALKEGLSKLYGYTSNKGGIRHAMLDESNLTHADAKYFLVSCTAFVNYLKTKV